MKRKVDSREQAAQDKTVSAPEEGAKSGSQPGAKATTKAGTGVKAKPVARAQAKATTKATPKPATEAKAKPRTRSPAKAGLKPKAKAEVETSVTAEPKLEVKREPEAEPKPAVEAEAKPVAKEEPRVEVKPETQIAPKPEAKAETKVQVKPEARPTVVMPRRLTVKQLADILGISPIDAIKHLMRNGVMAAINQTIEFEVASVVAGELGFEVKEESAPAAEAVPKIKPQLSEETRALKPRPPVVTIMGHVDHGKTKLLDAIRQTNVVDTEAGQITQHIGAYQVEVKGQKITFLDTPGHEAFTAMRARGAQVTDIAVLVVAADDGVMPQTVEAINHAKAAGVPIVVAINKIDKPTANVDRVKQQLADHGLIIEEWGGDVVCVPVSAKRGDGIADLLENLLIVAEVEELKADPNRSATGVVIEAKLDSSRGAIATVLVQNGTLEVGDYIVVGDNWGRVKAMFDDKGKRVRKAEPSTPVEVMGMSSVPQAGDILTAVRSEKEARAEAERRRREKEISGARVPKLSSILSQIQAGSVKDLNIILKTDVQGSIEPIRDSLEKLGTADVKVRIVHAGSGNITENDVLLAIASKGIIIGFNTRPEPGARRLADQEGVDIRIYQVIYTLVEDVGKALAGMLEPTYAEVIEGHGEVRAVFNISKGRIAGVYVTDGKISRGSSVRVRRKGQTVFEGQVTSLKHFKENVREIAAGFECGVGIEGYSEFEVGDILEVYRKEKV
jgi:translation initiation factor IF-2